MTNDFSTALSAFIRHIESLGLGYNHPSLKPDTLGTTAGPRYVRVFKDPHGSSSGRSVYCFVRKDDGTVLKPRGWKGPAKGSRGNIYDPSSWGNMSRYGVGYLR